MPPRITKHPIPRLTPAPSPQTHCHSCLHRAFSSTPAAPTKLRREFFGWLSGPGENFRTPLPNSTNYLSAYDKAGRLRRQTENGESDSVGPDTRDSIALERAATVQGSEKADPDELRPFPLNKHFRSEAVLSEELRTEIWKRVKIDGKSVRTVSVEMGVEMRRVGAVVRLVELERSMRAEDKPLAMPYARAVLSMLPTTPFNPSSPNSITVHETINDLPVHTLTKQQLFYPSSESRPFNRIDAGRVFSGAPRLPNSLDVAEGGTPKTPAWRDTEIEIVGKKGHEMQVLKPADSRIPHPHLIAHEQDKRDPDLRDKTDEILERYKERLDDDIKDRESAREKRTAREESRTTRIDTERWEFVVKEVKATRIGTGLDGRGTASPGYRYGVPAQDRKRAQIKIPTKVAV